MEVTGVELLGLVSKTIIKKIREKSKSGKYDFCIK